MSLKQSIWRRINPNGSKEIVNKHKIILEGIDDYGHLNNAAHPRYFEIERKYFAAYNGLDRLSLVSKGLAFLVKKAVYEYLIPVLCGQEVEIETEIVATKGVRVFVEQKMFHERGLVARCNTEYFFLDLPSKKPTRIPKGLYSLLQGKK